MEFSNFIYRRRFLKNIVLILFNSFFFIVRKYKKLFSNNSENILIIALHKLGDSVFTVPAVNEILKFHNNKISLVCFQGTEDIFKISFKNLDLVPLNHNEFYFTNRIASRRARKIIRKCDPGIIYDLTGTVTSAMLIFNSRAKEIIGINKDIFKNIYTTYSPVRKEPHITDIYLDVVRSKIPLTNDKFELINEKLINDGHILIHPFAGWEAKEWSLKNYIELTEFINENYNCMFVFPQKLLPHGIFEELSYKNLKYTETKTTTELIDVIKNSSAFIGNDSGPMHIANLLGKPTFTVYGPSNPDFHKPLTGINSYIVKKIKCSPKANEKLCFTNGGRRGCPSYECMNTLSLQEVQVKVMDFLGHLGLNKKQSANLK